jgi:hypothetical protein
MPGPRSMASSAEASRKKNRNENQENRDHPSRGQPHEGGRLICARRARQDSGNERRDTRERSRSRALSGGPNKLEFLQLTD